MTLEPIAAISVAIPENYRMLNIGLVDVGAGTSDICITKDGCVVAYGMIPVAGDKLTEIIAQNYLVDFNTAETIKCGISDSETVEYKDIMGLPQKVGRDEVLKLLDPQIEEMADLVAEKFKELNGGKPVSAVFVVGGGGTVEGYTKKLSEHLGIMAERVAVRGEEVMGHIIYQDDVKKDSRLVTPVGICLNYYDQSSNFIYVTFNDQHIKLYDGGNLAVVDAAMHADFPNDGLFPKRGEAINYRINGKQAMKRGLPGDPAVITVNGEEADMHTPIRANDVIRVKESTVGAKAKVTLSELPEFKSMITVYTNQSKILLPKFAEVNGEIKTGYYEIEDGDDIVMRNYYTLREVREFMDVILDESMAVLVNNEPADDDTKVFENFNIKWGIKEQILKDYEEIKAKNAAAQEEAERNAASKAAENAERSDAVFSSGEADGDLSDASDFDDDASDSDAAADSFDNLPEDDGEVEIKRPVREETEKKEEEATVIPRSIIVNVNGADVKLEGKESYVFVDVFDRINFDLKNVQGSRVVTELNGRPAMYMEQLNSGDHIVIKWEN
jgi:cell division ATPase FtsA